MARLCYSRQGVSICIEMASRTESDGQPRISAITPVAAIPGGEFQIRGKGMAGASRPVGTIGDVTAPIVVGSDFYVVVRGPEGTPAGGLILETGDPVSPPLDPGNPGSIACNLHPRAHPAVD